MPEGDLNDRARLYFPRPAHDPARQAAKHAAADTIRSLVDDLLFLDADAAEITSLATDLAAIRARAAALPTYRGKPRREWPADDIPLVERGPNTGATNPSAAPLHFESLTPTTKAWAVFGAVHEGGPGDMHGGVIMAAFDDVLGCAQMAGEVIGRTGTLSVRFITPSPLGVRIDFEAWIERVERRKVFVRGTSHHGDTLLAEAQGIFVAARGPLDGRPPDER